MVAFILPYFILLSCTFIPFKQYVACLSIYQISMKIILKSSAIYSLYISYTKQLNTKTASVYNIFLAAYYGLK